MFLYASLACPLCASDSLGELVLAKLVGLSLYTVDLENQLFDTKLLYQIKQTR